MAKRISHKNVGETFTILFTAENKSRKYQLTTFLGYTNVPDSWVARFSRSSLVPGEYGQTLEATRKNGRWVVGNEIIRSI